MADPYTFTFDVDAFLSGQEVEKETPPEGVMKRPAKEAEAKSDTPTESLMTRLATALKGTFPDSPALGATPQGDNSSGRNKALTDWTVSTEAFIPKYRGDVPAAMALQSSPVTTTDMGPDMGTLAMQDAQEQSAIRSVTGITESRGRPQPTAMTDVAGLTAMLEGEADAGVTLPSTDSVSDMPPTQGLMSPPVQDTVSGVDTTTAAAPVADDNVATYSVVSGDTLSKIAKANNTTVAELTAANPDIKDINKIDVGQELKLPTVTAEEAVTPVSDTTEDFYLKIGVHAESDHGSVPVPTKDDKEKNKPVAERSKDVGFGHKVKASEDTAGMIHGIKFKNDDGTYIPLTKEQKVTILNADMKAEASLARKSGWDAKLKKIGTSWDDLDTDYRNALTSLAYNTGGPKAGKLWTDVLTAAKDKDVTSFALHLRRTDNDNNTAGMDNRAVKELYYAGLIDSVADVATQLPLADKRSGIPLK